MGSGIRLLSHHDRCATMMKYMSETSNVGKKLFFTIVVLALTISGCQEKLDTSNSGDNSVNSAAENIANIAFSSMPTTGNAVCASQATYDTIKSIIFDEAAKQSTTDPVPLNDLRRSVSVKMEFPLVKSIDDRLERTDCSGRLIFVIPITETSAFGGDSELKADISYSVQPSADGSGNVITTSGFGFLLQRIVAANYMRVASRNANLGGPQLAPTYNPSFRASRLKSESLGIPFCADL